MKAGFLGKLPLSFPIRINLQGDFIHSLPCFINHCSNTVDSLPGEGGGGGGGVGVFSFQCISWLHQVGATQQTNQRLVSHWSTGLWSHNDIHFLKCALMVFCKKTQNQNSLIVNNPCLVLTSVSSSPFNSLVQKVLGPGPSNRVCWQWILFSDSQVAKLCRVRCSEVRKSTPRDK